MPVNLPLPIAQTIPTTTSQVLILPVFLCGIGAFAWWMGMASLSRGGKGRARILGGIFLGLALFHGFQLIWSLYEPKLGDFYRHSISRKMYFAHIVALVMPLMLIACFAVYGRVRKRRELDY